MMSMIRLSRKGIFFVGSGLPRLQQNHFSSSRTASNTRPASQMTSISQKRNVQTIEERQLWDFAETIKPSLPKNVMEFERMGSLFRECLQNVLKEANFHLLFEVRRIWDLKECDILGQHTLAFFPLHTPTTSLLHKNSSEVTVQGISECCVKAFELVLGQFQNTRRVDTGHLHGILHFSVVFRDEPRMTFHMIPALQQADRSLLLLGDKYSLIRNGFVTDFSKHLVGFNEMINFFSATIFQWNNAYPSSSILPQAIESILWQVTNDWMKVSFQVMYQYILNNLKAALQLRFKSWHLVGHLTPTARAELLVWLEKIPTKTPDLLQFALTGWTAFFLSTTITAQEIEASLDKTGPWKRLNVYLVGDSGAGKTSVKRWLLGQDFDPRPSNTDSAEVTTTRNWSEETFDIKDMIADRLVRPSFQKPTVTPTQTEAVGAEIQNEQQIDNNNNSTTSSVATESIIASPNQDIQVLSTQTDDGSNHLGFSILADIERYKLTLLHNELPMTFCIWDFGGQEVYHNTHYLFLTQTAIYLLVVDLSLEAVYLQSRVLFWLHSIRVHSQTAPIMIVGTHSDMISEQECNSRLLSIYKIAKSINHSPRERDIFAISCKDIKIQNQTRNQLQDIAEMLAAHIVCPLRWMLFYHTLQTKSVAQNCLGALNWLPIEQAYEAATSCGMTQDGMMDALSLCHECGFMLFYKDSNSLNNIIFMNPPQLVAVLRAVVTVAKETPDGHFIFGPSTKDMDVIPPSEEEIKVILSQGRFTNNILERLWKKYRHVFFQLRSLLEQFGLALPDPAQYDRPSIERDLIVPCLVQRQFSSDYFKDAELLEYSLTEVPLGLSSRLTVETLKLTQKQEYKIFLGGCIFTFEDITFKLVVLPGKVIIQMQRTTNQDGLMKALQKLLHHLAEFFQHLKVKNTMQLTCFVCHDKRIDVTHSNLNAICRNCQSELMELPKRFQKLEEQFKALSREHVKGSSQIEEEKEALLKEKVRIQKDLAEANLQVEKLCKVVMKSQSKSKLWKSPTSVESSTLEDALWKRLEEKITSYQQPRLFSEEQSHLAELIHTCDTNLSGLPSIECQKYLHPHAEGFGEAPDGPIFLLVLNNQYVGVEYHTNGFVLVGKESSAILGDMIDDIYQSVHKTVIGFPRFSHKTKAGGFCFKFSGNDTVIFPALKHTDGTNIILDKEHDEVIYKTPSDITVTIIGKFLLFDWNQTCSIQEQLCYGAVDEIITNCEGETTAKQVKSIFNSLARFSVSVRNWALSITELTDEHLLTQVFSIWKDFQKTASSMGPTDNVDEDTLIIDPKVISTDGTSITLQLTKDKGISPGDMLEAIFFRYNLAQQQVFDTIAKTRVTVNHSLDMIADVHNSKSISHPMERALVFLVKSDQVIGMTSNCWFHGRYKNQLPVRAVSNENQQSQSREHSNDGLSTQPSTMLNIFRRLLQSYNHEGNSDDNNDNEQRKQPPSDNNNNAHKSESSKMTLHRASYVGHLQIVKNYIEQDRNLVDALDMLHNTPLHCAVRGDQLEVIVYLMEQGADASLKNHRGYTPLDEARLQHQKEKARCVFSLYTSASPKLCAFWPPVIPIGLPCVITVISKIALNKPECYHERISLACDSSSQHVLHIPIQATAPLKLIVKPDKLHPEQTLEIPLEVRVDMDWSHSLLPSYEQHSQWKGQLCTAEERKLWEYSEKVVDALRQAQQPSSLTMWLERLEGSTNDFLVYHEKTTKFKSLCSTKIVEKNSTFCLFEYVHKISVLLNSNSPISAHTENTLEEPEMAYLSEACYAAICAVAPACKLERADHVLQFSVWPSFTCQCDIRPILRAFNGSFLKIVNPRTNKPYLAECERASFLQHVLRLELTLDGIQNLIGICKLLLRSFTKQNPSAKIPPLAVEITAYDLFHDWARKHSKEAPFFQVFQAIWEHLQASVQAGGIKFPTIAGAQITEKFERCDGLAEWIRAIRDLPEQELLSFLQTELEDLVPAVSSKHSESSPFRNLSFDQQEVYDRWDSKQEVYRLEETSHVQTLPKKETSQILSFRALVVAVVAIVVAAVIIRFV